MAANGKLPATAEILKRTLRDQQRSRRRGNCGSDASGLTTVFNSCWPLLLAPTSNGLSFRGLTVGLAPSRTWQRSLRQRQSRAEQSNLISSTVHTQWLFFPGKCDRNGNAISSNVMHKSLCGGALLTMTCVSGMLMDFPEIRKVHLLLLAPAKEQPYLNVTS